MILRRCTRSVAPSPVSPAVAGSGPCSAAVYPSGRFIFAANVSSKNVSAYSIDRTTGTLTPVPGSPFAAGTGPATVRVR